MDIVQTGCYFDDTYEEDIDDIWLTDGNGGGGLRGPTIAEFAITLKHTFVLI